MNWKGILAIAATLFTATLWEQAPAKNGIDATLPNGLIVSCTKNGECNGAWHWLNKRGAMFEAMCLEATNLDEVYPPYELYLQIIVQAQALDLGDLLLDGICFDKVRDLLETKADQIESACKATTKLSGRKNYLLQYIQVSDELQQYVPGHEGLDLLAFCDGLLDPESTYVVIEPEKLTLLPEEKATLTARIECGLKMCDGEFFWDSESPEVAFVTESEEPTSSIEVTAGALAGTTKISAKSEFSDWFSSFHTGQKLLGYSLVTVESQTELDVVFVIENSWQMELWFGPPEGFRTWGDEIADMLNSLFSSYRISLISYHHYSLHYDPLNTICMFPGPNPDYPEIGFAPYKPAYDVFGFVDSSDYENIVAGFESLSSTCKVPPGFGTGGEDASVYTALLHAIDGSSLGGWLPQDEVGLTRKAIVVIGKYPACKWGYAACIREDVSGYTKYDVIDAAEEKSIPIYFISGWYEGSPANQYFSSDWTHIASVSGGSYNESTPAFSGMLQTIEGVLEEISVN